MTELLKDLEAVALLAEKATPGPWTRNYDNDTGPNDDYYIEWQTAGPAELRGKNGQADADYIAALHNLIRTHHAEIAEAVADARRYREQMSKHYIRHPHQLIDMVRYANQFRPDWWMEKESWDSGIDFAIDAHNSAREVGE